MKILFPQKKYHKPKWYLINSENKSLGYISVLITKLLIAKENSFYTNNIDQGNFVLVINFNKIKISKKKQNKKLYYRNSNRPGNLKIETFSELNTRLPNRILLTAVKGMLKKNKITKNYLKRLFII